VGEWKETEISYLRASRTYCHLCGQLIPRRYWAADVEGEERIFCSPEHERTYRTYWLPRYGRATS
jgi:hypothetical protein